MKIKITILSVTSAVAEYAKKYGAIFDKEIGWYCYPPVPPELDEFQIAPKNSRNKQSDVQCPLCGSQMELKAARRNEYFWSCMLFPKCLGALNEEKVNHSSTSHISKIIPENFDTIRKIPKKDFTELAELGIKQIGNVIQFEKWLDTPKVALKGKKPVQVLGTEKGISKVLRLLNQINH